MATSAPQMKEKIAATAETSVVDTKATADVPVPDSGNLRQDLRPTQSAASEAMARVAPAIQILHTVLNKARGFKQGQDELRKLAAVKTFCSQNKNLSQELERIETKILESNKAGNLAIAGIGECIKDLVTVGQEGSTALTDVEHIMHIRPSVFAPFALGTAQLAASPGLSELDKKITSEAEVRQEMDAVLQIRKEQGVLMKDLSTDLKKAGAIIAEGVQSGDTALAALKATISKLQPDSAEALHLKGIQQQVEPLNKTGHSLDEKIKSYVDSLTLCQSAGLEAETGLIGFIAKLPPATALGAKPKPVLAYSTQGVVVSTAAAMPPASSSTVVATPAAGQQQALVSSAGNRGVF